MPLGGFHQGRPADPPGGGFAKTGQTRTWGGGGGVTGIRTSGNEKIKKSIIFPFSVKWDQYMFFSSYK